MRSFTICTPIITRAINSRKMRWAGHDARMEEMKNAYRNLVAKGRDRLRDPGIDRMKIYKMDVKEKKM
jgi:hypothetical protein